MKRLDPQILADLKASLVGDGMIFGLNPEQADQRLAERIGTKRFEAFCRTMHRVRAGLPLHEAYRLFTNTAEANVLMSAQSEVMLAVNTAVIEAGRLRSDSHNVVGEVGCFSGSVLRHLAGTLPETQFIGFDRVQKLLRSAQAISPRNARFVFWDYSARAAPKLHSGCDILCGAFPVDLSDPDLSYATDQEDAYRQIADHYGRQFGKAASRWRQIVVPGGLLVCCLRLPTAQAFAGAVHGATQVGWEPILDRCFRVLVGEESFPVLVFRAAESREAPEEEVRIYGLAFDSLEAWQP